MDRLGRGGLRSWTDPRTVPQCGLPRVKHVFWTDNQLGNGFHDALLALVNAGVLDRRAEPDEQFRWLDP